MKIGKGVQTLLEGILTLTHRLRQKGYLIGLLTVFQNKESRPKIGNQTDCWHYSLFFGIYALQQHENVNGASAL
jgi:hypothetical protein